MNFFLRQSRFILTAATIVGLAASAAAEYLTWGIVPGALFYLLPVGFASWYFSAWAGFLTAVIAAFLSRLVNVLVPDPAPFFVSYWSFVLQLSVYLLATSLLSRLKRELDHERSMARTDLLTGLRNVRAFYHASALEIDRSRRYRHNVTVAYLDVDNFKAVNDQMGHSGGDTLLKTVADTLRRTVRSFDVVARLGGDEFVLLLPETDFESARVVIERVQATLTEVMRANSWPVTFSIGVVTFRRPPDSVAEMIRRADRLMYVAKAEGKNTIRYETYPPPPSSML